MYKTLENGVTRDCSPEEISEIEARKADASQPVTPDRVPMLNAHLELIEAGWMPGVEAFIEGMPEPNRSLARAYFVQALTMARDNDLVKAIPAALGKTETEVDQLFIRAGARDV